MKYFVKIVKIKNCKNIKLLI